MAGPCPGAAGLVDPSEPDRDGCPRRACRVPGRGARARSGSAGDAAIRRAANFCATALSSKALEQQPGRAAAWTRRDARGVGAGRWRPVGRRQQRRHARRGDRSRGTQVDGHQCAGGGRTAARTTRSAPNGCGSRRSCTRRVPRRRAARAARRSACSSPVTPLDAPARAARELCMACLHVCCCQYVVLCADADLR